MGRVRKLSIKWNNARVMEEILREAACVGNLDGVRKLLQSGANINSQNSMNGWTALHWACKRGHRAVVTFLLQNGADINLETHQGQKPIDVTNDPDIMNLVEVPGHESASKQAQEDLPIVPNYLRCPPFPYEDISSQISAARLDLKGSNWSSPASKQANTELLGTSTPFQLAYGPQQSHQEGCLLVKVRVAGSGESDFVEVPVKEPSFRTLLDACCHELEVNRSNVVKIRKLPDVLVRKDTDVSRLIVGDRLELVVAIHDIS